jgi:poly-gamma-glutamate synthesis protein (capsule biosynthesis protein)
LTQTRVHEQAASAPPGRAKPEQASAPAVFDAGQGRVLLFAAATRSSGVPKEWAAGPGQAGVNRIDLFQWNVQQIGAQVRAVKRAGDIAVLSLHWGGNWGYEVEKDQRQFAHRVIDEAGIDLVHGHSSHHPRGIEVYRNKAIIYGCGDLINDYEGITPRHAEFRSELTLMYFPTLDPANGEVVRFEVSHAWRACVCSAPRWRRLNG